MQTVGYLDCGWEGVIVQDERMRDTNFLVDAYDEYRGKKVRIIIEEVTE